MQHNKYFLLFSYALMLMHGKMIYAGLRFQLNASKQKTHVTERHPLNSFQLRYSVAIS